MDADTFYSKFSVDIFTQGYFMLTAIKKYEFKRLNFLRSLQLLDTQPEERFDRITRIAKKLFDVEFSLISLVDDDRQWFKSKDGIDLCETQRDVSFCTHVIKFDDVFVVNDALLDRDFYKNPLVIGEPYIRFYAGYPLKIHGKYNIGTLCVLDDKPRKFSLEQRCLLQDLGRIVEQEIESINLATLDSLTTLPNRRGFSILAEHALNVCRREKKSCSVLMFDLDNLKEINDNYGHVEGDMAIKKFSYILSEVFRASDIVARFGGDDNTVFLADVAKKDIELIIKRLKSDVDIYNSKSNVDYNLEFSVGFFYKEYFEEYSLEAMLESADEKMYEDKRSE